ncbi:MAG: hypothetical protein AAGA32_11000 [Pseudomonadota bacterium]
MPETAPTAPLADLLRLETPKTWSLIVTIFGDLEGDRLTGKELGTLLGALGIRPEATRVALHRLRKDGWITSEKAGREVIYALSDHGRQETRAAEIDVYRREVKFASGWRLFVLGRDMGPEIEGPRIDLAKNLVLLPHEIGHAPLDALEVALAPGPLPVWVETQLVPSHLMAQAAALAELAETFPDAAMAAPEQVAARLLFLHYWRRMALRLGTWAHIGLAPNGTMAKCQSAVTALLARTGRTAPPSSESGD